MRDGNAGPSRRLRRCLRRRLLPSAAAFPCLRAALSASAASFSRARECGRIAVPTSPSRSPRRGAVSSSDRRLLESPPCRARTPFDRLPSPACHSAFRSDDFSLQLGNFPLRSLPPLASRVVLFLLQRLAARSSSCMTGAPPRRSRRHRFDLHARRTRLRRSGRWLCRAESDR